MNTSEIQRLKRAWLVARESGDTGEQTRLLRDHPEAQEALIDFIAAYAATGGVAASQPSADEPILPLTQRAFQRALDRVFVAAPAWNTLAELRKSRNLSKVDVAKGLRLGVDVWNKFEAGAIELISLSQQQLDRLARFFEVTTSQFGTLLDNSQPAISLNRRQTRAASEQEQTTPKQSLSDAIQRSTMSAEDQQFWLEN